MKKSILDASSAILLFKVDLLQELTDVYQVFVTGSVLQELTRGNHQGADSFLHFASLNKIRTIDSENILLKCKASGDSIYSLDQGEHDTIKCFAAGGYDFIITDDGRAARYCKKNGLPFINALLFPRLLYFADLISWQESNNKTDAIIRIGRYSTEVIEWARNCQKESLPFAMPCTVVY
jgi:predicted nucleic acid-binding protein